MNKKDLKFLTECPYLARSKIYALEHLGVLFIDSQRVYIGEDVEIGAGTLVWPGVILLGNTTIGQYCEIEEGVRLEDVSVGDFSTIRTASRISQTRIGKNCVIWGARMYHALLKDRVIVHSQNRIVWSTIGARCDIESDCHIKYARVASDCKVGPKAIIEGEKFDEEILARGKRSVRIGRSCRIGAQTHIHEWAIIQAGAEVAHCEIVRSTIGKGTKAKHCSYIGDVIMGCYSNVGAGTVFGNYDGEKKNQCEVGDGAFIGINTSVVSKSVKRIGDGAYIGAHTLVTKEVEEDTVVVREVGPQKVLRKRNAPEP
jgi:bifunctional N-acetylglucosamine-1-phosphate-uridyltransferase/glucosamine-1-phosphate-acetyltransferase GlmU-like protein